MYKFVADYRKDEVVAADDTSKVGPIRREVTFKASGWNDALRLAKDYTAAGEMLINIVLKTRNPKKG